MKELISIRSDARRRSHECGRGVPGGRGAYASGVALTLVFLMGALLAWPTTAEAQVPISAEARAGVTFPTGDLSDTGAEAGLALGAELMLTPWRNLTVYGGIHRQGFSCDSDCDLGNSVRSSGVNAGLKYIFPSPADALIWGRGGIVANRLSGSEFSGSRNIGFELGTGIDMPVGDRLYLVPHVGFVSHDAGEGIQATWFNFGLGGHYHIR